VVAFYGHASGQYRSFSNFYVHAPTTFEVPLRCWPPEFDAQGLPREVGP